MKHFELFYYGGESDTSSFYSKSSVSCITYNEGDSNPFWNATTKEIPKLLWLPKEQGSVSKSVKTLMSNSWFSVSMSVQTSNLQMNSSLLPSSLAPSIMDLVQQKIAEKQNSLHLVSFSNKKRNYENEKPAAEIA